jgi:hypothetical protein
MTNVLTPNPVNSDGQYARFYHLDIERLEDTQLTDELYALRPLLWGLPSDHWLRKRVRMLEAETGRRNWNARPKPRLSKGGP